jgi:small-conductance mechanosensitive channel/CRP-like cAMP-binding protein
VNLDSGALWAALFIIVIPGVVLLSTEVEERLRQRGSPLRRPLVIFRNWVLPAFAVWALLVPVLGLAHDRPLVRIVLTWLAVAITVVVLAIGSVIIGSFRSRTDASGRQAVPQLLLALPRLAVYVVAGWLLVAVVWGVDLSAALTALGVTSLVISFALQDTLSGLASGVLLLGDQPFQTGDWISSGNTVGKVIDINWRTSRILDRNGDVNIVPNSELADASITNYTDGGSIHRVVVPVQVAFKNAPTLAKDMLLDAARGTPNVRSDPPPAVRVVQIDDPLMSYEVDLWIDDFADQPRVLSDFGSLVWYQSHRHNVPLPSPAQDLYLWDGPTELATGTPATSTLRRQLADSPFLESLPDADIDRMAHVARAQRYAVGEMMIAPGATHRDLMVLVEGAAELVLVADDGSDELIVATANDGDLIGLLSGERVPGYALGLRAVSDCEVLLVDGDTASDIGSRHADLAAALDRMATTRRRRIERIMDGRARQPVPVAGPAGEDTGDAGTPVATTPAAATASGGAGAPTIEQPDGDGGAA